MISLFCHALKRKLAKGYGRVFFGSALIAQGSIARLDFQGCRLGEYSEGIIAWIPDGLDALHKGSAAFGFSDELSRAHCQLTQYSVRLLLDLKSLLLRGYATCGVEEVDSDEYLMDYLVLLTVWDCR